MTVQHVIKNLVPFLFIFPILTLPEPSLAQTTLYGVDRNNKLYKIHLENTDNSAQLVRLLAIPGTAAGLAADGQDLVILESPTSPAASTIYIFDPNPNGAPTPFFTIPAPPPNVPLPAGLANTPPGDLYYCPPVSSSSCNLEVNAAGPNPPPTGQLNFSVHDLAYNPLDSTLYGTGRDGQGEGLFKLINGSSMRIGPTDLGSQTCGTLSGVVGVSGLEYHRGLLFGSVASCLVTVNTVNGNLTFVNNLGQGIDLLGLGSVTPFGKPDFWIQDCPQDTGTIPSACPRWWASDDIWLDNNDDGVIDAPPPEGMQAHVYARVRNRGTGVAANVTVNFYYADGSTSVMCPPKDPNNPTCTLIGQTSVTVPPGGAVPAMHTWTTPPAPAPGSHWCLIVALESPDDPYTRPIQSAQLDNNIAISNVWSITARAGERTGVSLAVGTQAAIALFGSSAKFWPRRFVLRVDDQLPQGWTWVMTGSFQPNQAFTLDQGQNKNRVLITVTPPVGTAPRSGASLKSNRWMLPQESMLVPRG